jgi:hypothetical protein
MRIKFEINLQAIRLLRKEFMIFLANYNQHGQLFMIMQSKEAEPGNFVDGVTMFVLVLQHY